MGHRDDPNDSLVNAIDHAVGICLQDETPCAPTMARPAIRRVCYQFEGVVERDQKAVCRLRAAFPVVHLPIGDICLGLGKEPEFTCGHAAI